MHKQATPCPRFRCSQQLRTFVLRPHIKRGRGFGRRGVAFLDGLHTMKYGIASDSSSSPASTPPSAQPPCVRCERSRRTRQTATIKWHDILSVADHCILEDSSERRNSRSKSCTHSESTRKNWWIVKREMKTVFFDQCEKPEFLTA